MASIERTAYPRFKPSLTANELQALYAQPRRSGSSSRCMREAPPSN